MVWEYNQHEDFVPYYDKLRGKWAVSIQYLNVWYFSTQEKAILALPKLMEYREKVLTWVEERNQQYYKRLAEEEEYRLSHAEEIQFALSQALQQLDSDNGALALIHATRIKDADSTLSERLDSVEIELKDILSDIQRLYDHTERDPLRLDAVQARISALQTLMKKHRVGTIDELIALRDNLAEQVERLENMDEELAHLTQKCSKARKQLEDKASLLTLSRQAVCTTIETHLVEDMQRLGIPHAKVAVEILPSEEFTKQEKTMCSLCLQPTSTSRYAV